MDAQKMRSVSISISIGLHPNVNILNSRQKSHRRISPHVLGSFEDHNFKITETTRNPFSTHSFDSFTLALLTLLPILSLRHALELGRFCPRGSRVRGFNRIGKRDMSLFDLESTQTFLWPLGSTRSVNPSLAKRTCRLNASQMAPMPRLAT